MKITSLLYTVLVSSILVFFPSLVLSQVPLTMAPAEEARTTPAGFCCSNGQIVPSSQAQCKKSGQYYSSRAEALRYCGPTTVFCCSNGKVREISPEQCKRSQGTIYSTATDAKRNCRPEAIYCCVKGKVKKVSPEECSRVKGTAYTTGDEAKRKCNGICQ